MKGSTIKRGASWSYIIDLDKDPETGKRRQKWRSGFDTERAADKALRAELRARETGAFLEPSTQTFGEFLEGWLAGVSADLRPSTVLGYKWAIQKHTIPHLGAVKLQSVTAAMLSKLFADLRQTLGARSVGHIATVLRSAITSALEQEILIKNPFVGARRPRRDSSKELKTWAPAQLRTFLDFVKDDRLYGAYILAATTGMRRGEVLGIRWRDVDLAGGWLTVQQALVAVGYEIFVSAPKTNRSRRMVALDEVTVAALVDHRLRMISERALLDLPAPAGDDLVFTDVEGAAIHPQALSGFFRRRVKASGMPMLTLHGLRHTWATLALQANVHPKTVSERLGHSNISITLDVYSHAIPALQVDAADKVANLIFES